MRRERLKEKVLRRETQGFIPVLHQAISEPKKATVIVTEVLTQDYVLKIAFILKDFILVPQKVPKEHSLCLKNQTTDSQRLLKAKTPTVIFLSIHQT